LSLTPLLAAVALAGIAARRGVIAGLWLRPWETAVFAVLVLLVLVPLGRRDAPAKKGRGGRAAPKPPKPPVTGRRRGLPKKK
jgi:hypothetical protein